MAEPAFRGFVETTLDALLIFEGCRRGALSKITRRLQEFEKRELVQSGAVFVFDEQETGIKRWTDGLQWSPSRTLGNFLVYRELDRKTQRPDGEEVSARPVGSMAEKGPEPSAAFPFGGANGDPAALAAARRQRSLSDSSSGAILDRERERQLVGSLTSSHRFRSDGLVKKTISLSGVHLIGYYRIDDVTSGRLRTPSSHAEFQSFEIHSSFLSPTLFRVPPLVEMGLDGVLRYKGEQQEHSPPGSIIPYGGPQSRPASSDSGSSSRRASPHLAPLAYTGPPSARGDRPPSSPRPTSSLRTNRFDPYPTSRTSSQLPLLSQPAYPSNSYYPLPPRDGRKAEEGPSPTSSLSSSMEVPNPGYYTQPRYSMPFLPSEQSASLSISPGRNTPFAYYPPPTTSEASSWFPTSRRPESYDTGAFGAGRVRGTNFPNYVTGHSLPSSHSPYPSTDYHPRRPYTQPQATPHSLSHAPTPYGSIGSHFDPVHFRQTPQPTSHHIDPPASSYPYSISTHQPPYPSHESYHQSPLQPAVSPNPSNSSSFSMHSIPTDPSPQMSSNGLRSGAYDNDVTSPIQLPGPMQGALGLVEEEPLNAGLGGEVPLKTESGQERPGALNAMRDNNGNSAPRGGERESYQGTGVMSIGELGRIGDAHHYSRRTSDDPHLADSATYYQEKRALPPSPPQQQERNTWWKDGVQTWQPAHVE